MIDAVMLQCVKFTIASLALMPQRLRITFLANVFKFGTLFVPSYRRISHINLTLAFPDKDKTWRDDLINKNFYSLATAISDFVRMPTLTPEWVKEHVEFPYYEKYKKYKAENPTKGILAATGHLGSFELQGYLMSVLGFPLSFVIRNFKSEKIDNWWNARRGKLGNKNINRRGAFRELVRELKRGFDVGILFDQNVKRSHAVFVPWFGKNAATAKSLALAALETEALVVVVSLKTLAIDSYYMDVIECDFSHIYSDETLSRQEKILQITTIVSKHYEKMIQDFPEGWFWMHRRWKTSEREDVPETFYK